MSLPRAIAKDTAETLVYFNAPELLAFRVASGLAQSYPEMKQMKQQERDYLTNYRFLGGDYIDKTTNYKSRARAMEHIKRSRQNLQTGIGSEARRYHR